MTSAPPNVTEGVGVIGLGLLGSALAERLLVAQIPVLGYDLSATVSEKFQQAGGEIASSPGEVARRCSCLLLSLPNAQVVETVLSSLDETLRPGTIILDTTTSPPAAAQAFAARLSQRAVTYLEANVAGSSAQARVGEALLLVGGDAAAIQEVRLLLSVLASRWFSVGPIGAASTLKLVVNLVLGLQRAVVAEGLALAERCGLDLACTLEVLQAGPTAAQVLQTKAPKMLASEFTPVARLAQHLKDVDLILQLGAEQRAALPLSTVHRQLLQQVVDLGGGDLDNSAIIQAFRDQPAT